MIGDQINIQLFYTQELLSAFNSYNIKCLWRLIHAWNDKAKLPCSGSLDIRTSVKHSYYLLNKYFIS